VGEEQPQHPLEAEEVFEIQPEQRRFRQSKQESSEPNFLRVVVLKFLPARIDFSEKIASYRG